VRVLLDEMLSAAIAEQLRARERDVEAVAERGDLRGLNDPDLFACAQTAGRAVVTYNRDDFLELDRRFRSRARHHHGIVILNPKRFPQGMASSGSIVASLDRLIAIGSPYGSFVHWLQ